MMEKKYQRDCFWFYVLIWMACLLVYSLTSAFVANDGFWHMAMGRYIYQSGTVPHTAVGAWGGDVLYWLPQEWLYELGIYALFRDNMIGVCAFTVVLIAGILFLIGLLAGIHKDIFKKPWAVLLYFLISLFSMQSFIVPRPQSVSLLLMILFVYLLRRLFVTGVMRKQDYVLYGLLGIFWANVHAGTVILSYLIPIGIAICYMITDKFPVFQDYFDIDHKEKLSHQFSWVACIMAVACFCTPNGLLGFLYPIHSMGDGLMLSVITEWAQPNINDLQGLVMYYIPFFAFYGWLFFTKQRVKVFDFAVISFLFVLGILHLRLVLYLLPVLLFLWTPYLSVYRKFGVMKSWRWVYTAMMSCICCIMIVFNLRANTLEFEGYTNQEFFDIVKDQCGDRMYNYYDLGSILQYYDIPVFVDARYDPFSEERMPDFVQTQYADSDSKLLAEIMEKYDFTSVLDMQDSSVILYAKEHGFEKVAEWNTGNVTKDNAGENVGLVYEFWVKK